MDRKKLLGSMGLMTISQLALRGVGMAYRVVLSERIGAEGMGLYQLIQTVYMLFSMVSCAGLAITVSRLCAESPRAQRSIVGRSCGYAVAFGSALGAMLYFAAEGIAACLLGDARAAQALRWIAPSLPLMGLSAALRGYFLSVGDVARPTIAQGVEQLFRVSLVLGILFLFDVRELTQACAVILFGATAAEVLSCALHIAFYARRSERTRESFPLCGILRGVLPLLMGSLMQSVMQTAENLLLPQLLRAHGLTAAQALEQYGLLGGMVLPVLLFPAALPASLGTLLLPEIARENALGHAARVRHLTRRTLRSTLMLSVACCAGFALCGTWMMKLLYKSEAAGGLLLTVTPLLPLLYLDGVCDALLKGLGKQGATMVVESADSALRILGIVVLLPRMGMLGYIVVLYLSAALCCLARLVLLVRATGLPRSTLLLLLSPMGSKKEQMRA